MSVISNEFIIVATVSVIDTHHHLDLRATNLSTLVAQKLAWSHGTSVMPSRCPIRQTSQRLSAAAAGVVADVEVVVPVAAAGNAAQAGELSPLCFDLRHSSNRSRILSLFSLRRLSLLS